MSPEHYVVEIRVDYRLNGCSGSAVLSNISAPIARPQLAPGSPNVGTRFDNPSFGTGSEGWVFDHPDFLGVSGTLTSDATAIGVLTFNRYAGCGSGVANWAATRR